MSQTDLEEKSPLVIVTETPSKSFVDAAMLCTECTIKLMVGEFV
jgi:hypothetical protein